MLPPGTGQTHRRQTHTLSKPHSSPFGAPTHRKPSPTRFDARQAPKLAARRGTSRKILTVAPTGEPEAKTISAPPATDSRRLRQAPDFGPRGEQLQTPPCRVGTLGTNGQEEKCPQRAVSIDTLRRASARTCAAELIGSDELRSSPGTASVHPPIDGPALHQRWRLFQTCAESAGRRRMCQHVHENRTGIKSRRLPRVMAACSRMSGDGSWARRGDFFADGLRTRPQLPAARTPQPNSGSACDSRVAETRR